MSQHNEKQLQPQDHRHLTDDPDPSHLGRPASRPIARPTEGQRCATETACFPSCSVHFRDRVGHAIGCRDDAVKGPRGPAPKCTRHLARQPGTPCATALSSALACTSAATERSTVGAESSSVMFPAAPRFQKRTLCTPPVLHRPWAGEPTAWAGPLPWGGETLRCWKSPPGTWANGLAPVGSPPQQRKTLSRRSRTEVRGRRPDPEEAQIGLFPDQSQTQRLPTPTQPPNTEASDRLQTFWLLPLNTRHNRQKALRPQGAP